MIGLDTTCSKAVDGQGHETVNFRGQVVTGPGHTTPKID